MNCKIFTYNFIVIFLLLPLLIYSQNYGNEWINYSQLYYKIKITQNGIYRIDSTVLAQANIPLSTINPKNFQIFGRGKEIPIYIYGENDGVFNSNDYIEFYAERNDGWFDSSLYKGVNNQANPYYSLFNDTAIYYLTWNNSLTNNRFQIENDTNFSAYTATNFVWKENVYYFNSYYYLGETFPAGTYTINDPEYVESKGWFDNPITRGGTKSKTVSTLNAYTSGPNAILKIAIAGQSNYNLLNPDHHISIQFSTVNFDTLFEGYKLLHFNFSIPSSSLTSSSENLIFSSINDLGSPNNPDRSALSYIIFKYPHTLNFEGANSFAFYLDDNPSSNKSLLNITNFTASGNIFIYDITNKKRINVENISGTLKALIPNNGNEKFCVISSDSYVNNVNKIYPVSANAQFTDYLSITPDSAYVIITHPKLMSAANTYASYRQLTGYNVLLVNVKELYEQFSYGIQQHPLAIRNFLKYIYDNKSYKPYLLFLLGKGYLAKDTRKNAVLYSKNLIPTFGNPPTDILFTVKFKNNDFAPSIGTGRLAAKTGADILSYLNKIQEYESLPYEEWMKTVLHFAGGSNIYEQQVFLNNVNNYKSIIEDTLFGGNVYTFVKQISAPIQYSTALLIKDYVETGTEIMTFFSHAFGANFDQNIESPDFYNNTNGRYPFLMAAACLVGNLFSTVPSTSEQFVLHKRGMIGFFAASSLADAGTQNEILVNLYKNISSYNYGGNIGVSVMNALSAIQTTNMSIYRKHTSLTYLLHGDPALRLHYSQLPDYTFSSPNVFYNPEPITTETDSFTINIISSNIGKAVNDSMWIEIFHSYPANKFDTIYSFQVKAPFFKDTFKIKIPLDFPDMVGLNNLTITLDKFNEINEYNESNNLISSELLISSEGIIPVYPYPYAIVPEKNIKLIASTGNPFAQNKNYIFEIDTTDLFNSPVLEKKVINSNGGILSWSPNLTKQLPDSTVFFWRVSTDSIEWIERSFQYIKGKEGWGQAHFFQLKEDKFNFINYNRNTRQLEFVPSNHLLKANVQGDTYANSWRLTNFTLDANVIDYSGYTLNGPDMHIVVFDSLSLEAWGTPRNGLNPDHDFGQYNDGTVGGRNRPDYYFVFRTYVPQEMQAMKNMLLKYIPNNNYILAYTWRRGDFTKWPADVKNAFSKLGSKAINFLGDSIPYIFFVKKGHPETMKEIWGDHYGDTISLFAILSPKIIFGKINSVQIGPASRWDSLFWHTYALEANSKDSSVLSVYGLTSPTSNETKLINYLTTDSTDIKITGRIDAKQYPYLKLKMYTSDDSSSTPAQINRWQVTYEGVPEAALAPNIYFKFTDDTLFEGENLHLDIAVANISKYDMDSLLVKFWIKDEIKKLIPINYSRQAPLKADSIIILSLSYPTKGMAGNYSLIIEVNPDNDQAELYHFNNLGEIPFYVSKDIANPVLDVTFDGIHILDGDIVSAKPEILIQVIDENKYLLLNDTSDFNVYLTYPNGKEMRIPFIDKNGKEILEFIPANSSKNSCKIYYRPYFNIDGIYKLRVNASDISGNSSGNYDYEISFEVINKPTITNFINYPNPFSSSTKFVFTLTGWQIPDVLKIQIITVTGKIIKEINLNELGPIHIGRNITQNGWDGTDRFGDPVGNGVYLYRVIAKINGENIEQRSTSADWYFKKGFGKMYLMR